MSDTQSTKVGFSGLRVISFESRRAGDIERLIRQMGGEPLVAPSMQEVPLEDQAQALYFGERLLGGAIDVLVLLTGVGTRTLIQALTSKYPRADIVRALSRITLVARGPKPVLALAELELKPTIAVPEPNTWQEVLSAMDAQLSFNDLRVAVQEYGTSNEEFLKALQARGAEVIRVPVYRWALPEDVGPLRRAVQAVCDQKTDILLFTSSPQVQHVLQVADMMGLKANFLEGTRRCVVASVGPICTEELTQQGLQVDVQPANPHMGSLLQETGQKSAAILRSKRTEK